MCLPPCFLARLKRTSSPHPALLDSAYNTCGREAVMQLNETISVEIRPWCDDDLAVLQRIFGDPQVMEFLGQVETPEQIQKRHQRYLTGSSGMLHMFGIRVGPGKQGAGLVGYWEHESNGALMYETGWVVLPEFQGQGIATRAALLAAELARREHKFRYLHAYAAVANNASNAVCRKAGFTLQGEVDISDSPPAPPMRYNDWMMDLGE
jgi:RimJ/RimL family protein N-acetyltransferase